MKQLLTIEDPDLGQSFPVPHVYKERKASRAVVFDSEGKIALLNATKKKYHKLPGGGIETGEDIVTALEREVLEEIGCSIGYLRELGIIEEYRNKFELHQTSYCFLADLVGEKGAPHFEDGEIADGFNPEWVSLEEAVTILEGEAHVENYEGKFIRLRDLTFLKAAAQN